MTFPNRHKDPNDIVDIPGFDWASEFLGTRTIVTSEWTVPAGVTKVSDAVAAGITSVRVSGGTDQKSYLLTNRVVLSTGEDFSRHLELFVQRL